MKNPQILLSILIPCWNSSGSIKAAIESVTSQLDDNFEIIAVDDASTDATWEILESLNKTNAQIKIFKNATNLGPSVSRNFAIEASRGKYIGFLDADDYYQSDFLKKFVKSFESCNEDILKFGMLQQNRYSNKKKKKLTSTPFHSQNKAEIIEEAVGLECLPVFGFVTNGFYKSSFIKANKILFEEDLRFAEDFFFNFEMIKHCKSFKFIEEIGYCYNKGSDCSLSSIEVINYLQIYLKKINCFYRAGEDLNCLNKILPNLQKLLIRTLYSAGVRNYDKYHSYNQVRAVIRETCRLPMVSSILCYKGKQSILISFVRLPLQFGLYLPFVFFVICLAFLKRYARPLFDRL